MPALAAPPDSGSIIAILICAVAGALGRESPAARARQAAMCARIRMVPPTIDSLWAGRVAAEDARAPLTVDATGAAGAFQARATMEPGVCAPLERTRDPGRSLGGDHAWLDDGYAADDIVADSSRGSQSRRRRNRISHDRGTDPPLRLPRCAH